ncbi:MAG: nuclear transport factor 2 family protein [Actinomycetota bacterium]
MSEENVERFWRGTTAYNDGDWDAALATMDPNVEFDLSRVMPEMEMYRGYEGVKAFWRMLRDVWGDFRTDPEEVIDAGDKLFNRNRLYGTGITSGVATEDVLYQVVTLRDGRAMRVEFFRDRSEALDAAGLSE